MNNNKVLTMVAIAAMVLIPTSIAMANPAPGDEDEGDEPPSTVNENAPPIDPEVVYELIPDDTLLNRTANEWTSQYDSQAELEKLTAAMSQYVTGTRPDNAWNDDVVDGHIVLLNFETIAGERGINLELVALTAKKQMLEDAYDQPDPIQTYHKWLFQQYSMPSTVTEVDAKIAEIVSDQNVRDLIPQLVDVYHTMTMRGEVPKALYDENQLYWDRVLAASLCADNPDCDETQLLAELNLPPPTQQQLDDLNTFIANDGINPDTGEAYPCGFIPCADASGSWVKENRYNSLFAKMTPTSCDDGTGSQCTIIDYDDGVGVNSAFARGEDNHAYSTVAAIHIKAVAAYTTIIKVEGEATIGYDTNTYGPVYWYGTSEIDDPDDSFSTTCSSGGHGGGGCGTYDVSGTSHGYAYVWVPDN